jgi:DNA replication protein DnaC
MLMEPLLDKLHTLRLPAFREGLREQMGNPQYAELAFEERLALLVEKECLRRQNRSLQRRLKQAVFPVSAVMADVDLSPARGLDRSQVLDLAQGNWVEAKRNVLIVGPTGSGKTYLACALGEANCIAGYTVRYQRTSRLLASLVKARKDGDYTDCLRDLSRVDLLILDDWMRDVVEVEQARELLEVLDDRFNHSATMVAGQVPVDEWYRRIPDPTLAEAILDLLIHNAYRLELTGESQRKLRGFRPMSNT